MYFTGQKIKKNSSAKKKFLQPVLSAGTVPQKKD